MLAASLQDREPTRVLAIGCHPADIEIGCGGTILELAGRRPELEVTWLVLSQAATALGFVYEATRSRQGASTSLRARKPSA